MGPLDPRAECNRSGPDRLQFAPDQMRSIQSAGVSNARSPAALEANGHRIAYELRGTGVPVAGTGYPGATWPPEFVAPLAEHHAVLTFDHRGTGATPPSPERYSTRLFAADALALMDGLGLERAHVLGHSMGGRVAQWMALDRPDRVRSLVLAATGPGQFRDDRPVTRGIPVHAAKAHPDRVRWLHETFWAHRPDLENYLRHVVARQEHQTAERIGEIRLPTL